MKRTEFEKIYRTKREKKVFKEGVTKYYVNKEKKKVMLKHNTFHNFFTIIIEVMNCHWFLHETQFYCLILRIC